MACGHEMKDCATGHRQERAELKAQGVARLNFTVLILFCWFSPCVCIACALNACVCNALPPILVISRATHGKVNSALAG